MPISQDERMLISLGFEPSREDDELRQLGFEPATSKMDSELAALGFEAAPADELAALGFGPSPDQMGILEKLKDPALKIAGAFNAVNAGTWAGIGAIFGDEDFKTLYYKYQDEGNPISEAARNVVRDMGGNKWSMAIAGFIGDVLGDPLTYTGVGALTKIGKTAKIAKGANKIAGTGRKIAKLNQRLAQIAPEARRLAPTLREQAKLGQRALVRFGPLKLKGERVLGAADVIGEKVRPALHLFKTGNKIKDKQMREVFNQAVREERNLARFFREMLDDRIAILKTDMDALPEANRKLVSKIAENPELFAKARQGAFGDAGQMAVKFDDFNQLNKALRENNPEALREIGAGNLAGLWSHDVPVLGGNYGRILKSYSIAADRIKDSILKNAVEQTTRKYDNATAVLKREVRSAELWGKNQKKLIDAKMQPARNKISAKFRSDLRTGVDRAVAQGRRDEATDALLASFDARKGAIDEAVDTRIVASEQRYSTKISDFDDFIQNTIDTKMGSSKRYQMLNEYKSALEEAHRDMPRYVPHVIPSEARQAFGKKIGAASVHGESVGDEITRKLLNAEGLPGYTIDDINRFSQMPYEALVSEGIPKETARRITKVMQKRDEFFREPNILGFLKKRPAEANEFFSTNPGFIMRTEAQRTSKAIGGARFRNAIGKGLGKTADDIAANPAKYDDWVEIAAWKGTPEGRLKFSPEIADEIKAVERAYTGDEATNAALRVFDRVQNWWKAWTLAPFPGYHSRNLGSAIWNNVLAGQYNPKYYTQAAQLQKGSAMLAKGLTKDGENFLKAVKLENGMDGLEALRLARQNGISGRSLFDAELITGAKPSKRWYSAEGPWIRAGRKAGAAIEDNVRLSHFLHRLDEGYDAADAAKSVMKFQFDYGDITAFEKNFMARAMPFYRFTRFNIPLQVQLAIESPGKFAAMEKFRRNVNRSQDLPSYKESFLTEYLGANVPIQLGRKTVRGEEMPRLFALGNWLPSFTAIANLGHPIETMVGMVTPILKTPFEQWQNFDYFRKRPIVDPASGRYNEPFLNIKVPARLKHVVKNMRLLNEGDRIFGALITQVSPERSEYIIKSGYKPELFDQMTRFFTGVTLSPTDMTQAKRLKLFQLRRDMVTAMKGVKSAMRRGDKANAEVGLRKLAEIRTNLAAVVGLGQNIQGQQ